MDFKLDKDPLDEARDFEIPNLSTAVLHKYYPEIKNDWTLGTQAVTKEGRIYSRTFQDLEFFNSPVSFIEVPLGKYDPFYESDRYYALSNEFKEYTYTSSISQTNEAEDFLRWQKFCSLIRQEIRYSPKKIQTVNWFRVAPDENGNYPDFSKDKILYGEEVYFLVSSPQINTNLSKYTLIPKLDLNAPTTITIDSGVAIKAKIKVNDKTKIICKLKSRDRQKEIEVKNLNNIVLTLPLIEITILELTEYIKPTILSNNNFINRSYNSATVQELKPDITFEFFGEEKLRTFIPSFDEDEPIITRHSVDTNLEERLKPPELPNVADNFWNTYVSTVYIEDFGSRTNRPQLMKETN